MGLYYSVGLVKALCDKTTGGSLSNIFDGGRLAVYSGSKTWSGAGDDATTGHTLLLEYTNVQFGAAVYDSVNKRCSISISSAISATAIATGTATWARLYAGEAANDRDLATVVGSVEPIRFDMSVGTEGSSSDLQYSTTTVTTGQIRPLGTFTLRISQVG